MDISSLSLSSDHEAPTMMYQLFHQKRFRNINEIRRLLSEGTDVNGKFSPGEN